MAENTLNVKLHGLRRSRHGGDFQLAVIEYAIIKLLLKQKKDFTLESENWKEYPKFDDMVISFKDNNNEILHLYQMKHSFKPVILSLDDLKSEFFNIKKHFNEWIKIKEKNENKDKKLKFYFITNKILDPKDFNEYIRTYIEEYVNKKNIEKDNIVIYENDIDQLLGNILTNKIAILSAHLDECHKKGIEKIIKDKLKENSKMINNLMNSINSFVENQVKQKMGKYSQINKHWKQGGNIKKIVKIKNFIDGFPLVVECKYLENDTLIKLIKWLSSESKKELKELIENKISDEPKNLIKTAIKNYITDINTKQYEIKNDILKDWKFIDSIDLYTELQRILPNAEKDYLNDLKEELNKLKVNYSGNYQIVEVEKKENEIFEEFSLFEIDSNKISNSEIIEPKKFKEFLENLKIIQLPHLDELIPKIQEEVKKYLKQLNFQMKQNSESNEDIFNRFHIFMEKWFRSNSYTINSEDLKTIKNILSYNLVHEE